MSWRPEDCETVRQMIKHESDVTNHRLTWLVTLQGFLFAALGFAWRDGKQLIPLLSVIGIASSISMLFPLYCADAAIRDLVRRWDTEKPVDFVGPDVVGYRPTGRLISLFLPWFLLPAILAVGWVVVWARA